MARVALGPKFVQFFDPVLKALNMFRERWIQDNGQWFTRVVGLVPNRQETDSRRAG
jgi:hypothetical protein